MFHKRKKVLVRFGNIIKRMKGGHASRFSVEQVQVAWLLFIRLFVLYILLFCEVLAPYISSDYSISQQHYLSVPLIVFFIFSAWSAFALRTNSLKTWYLASQNLIDVFVVTWIVYLSGGPASPFLFLYLPVVMLTAILLSYAHALWMALLSIILYSLLSFMSIAGIVKQIDGTSMTSVPSGGAALQILGLFSAMALVAVATSYLVKALKFSHTLVAKSQKEFRELSIRQRTLIEGIPEGVGTTLNDFTILSVNSAVERLLNIKEKEILSQSLPNFLSSLSEDFDAENFFGEKLSVQREIKVIDQEGNRKFIAFYGRSLHGDETSIGSFIFVFQDITALRSVEERLATQDRLARLMANATTSAESVSAIPELVGESQIMRKMFTLIERVAPSDATVLIGGESGTGKELAAKAIHAGSSRSNKPFVAVNCGAIPENLIESQLFGHRKGSFTGAIGDHDGFFREADGGTIFLDEIGELPLHLQTKLLRVLQERFVRPVGGERDFSVDVRIVAATNRNLGREADLGRFRQDLFYRLNVININLPPLRDRKEDIPLLVSSLVTRLLDDIRLMPNIPPETMKLLLDYDYPGNVRELENILERALVLGGDALLPEHLPDTVRSPVVIQEASSSVAITDPSFPVNLDQILGEIEKNYLIEALEHSHGVRKKAAEILGINFRSFRYRLQKFGIHDGQ